MNFYIVFTKSRKRFDKYVKVNKIKNKVIIDIKSLLDEYDIDNYTDYKHYFNLIVYTKITHSLDKNKDVYYMPNFSNKNFDITEIFKIKDILKDTKFNVLIFYDEFKDDNNINNSIIENMDIFDASQILKSY